ncbi:hypothetical protein DFJ73DRAFT_920314 [Zopfochytrium polystomum]|nr:hypothetical protein DFJ73DRAFT_920314 [Zopfochytrium polystomum]
MPSSPTQPLFLPATTPSSTAATRPVVFTTTTTTNAPTALSAALSAAAGSDSRSSNSSGISNSSWNIAARMRAFRHASGNAPVAGAAEAVGRRGTALPSGEETTFATTNLAAGAAAASGSNPAGGNGGFLISSAQPRRPHLPPERALSTTSLTNYTGFEEGLAATVELGASEKFEEMAFNPPGTPPKRPYSVDQRDEHPELSSSLRLKASVENQRGTEGETILHFAILRKPELALRIARACTDSFINAKYIGDRVDAKVSGYEFRYDREVRGSLYNGQTVLQFAACTGNLEVVKLVVNSFYERRHLNPGSSNDFARNNVFHVLAMRKDFNPAIVSYLKYVLARADSADNIPTVAQTTAPPSSGAVSQQVQPPQRQGSQHSTPETSPAPIIRGKAVVFSGGSRPGTPDLANVGGTHPTPPRTMSTPPSVFTTVQPQQPQTGDSADPSRASSEPRSSSSTNRSREWAYQKPLTISLGMLDALSAKNQLNLTPMQLGAYKGNPKALDMIRLNWWKFGNVSSSLVPLGQLLGPREDEKDSTPSEQDTTSATWNEWQEKSPLQIAVERGQADVIAHPFMQSIVFIKWHLYARRTFMRSFLRSLLTLSVFTASLALQPSDPHDRFHYTTKHPGLRGLLDLAAIILVLLFVASEARKLISQRLRLADSLRHQTVEYYCLPFFSFFVLLASIHRIGATAAGPAYEARGQAVENALLGIANVAGWLGMLYYTKAFRTVGPLYIAFKKAIGGDLWTWSYVFVAMMLGFAGAFFLQMNGDSTQAQDWENYFLGVVTTSRVIFGQTQYDEFRTAESPGFALTLVMIYTILTVVLILNILIAKLSQTFTKIVEDAEKQWLVQFAGFVVENDYWLHEEESKLYAHHLGHRDHSKTSGRYLTFLEKAVAPDGADAGAPTATEVLKVVVAYEDRRTNEKSKLAGDHKVSSGFDTPPFRQTPPPTPKLVDSVPGDGGGGVGSGGGESPAVAATAAAASAVHAPPPVDFVPVELELDRDGLWRGLWRRDEWFGERGVLRVSWGRWRRDVLAQCLPFFRAGAGEQRVEEVNLWHGHPVRRTVPELKHKHNKAVDNKDNVASLDDDDFVDGGGACGGAEKGKPSRSQPDPRRPQPAPPPPPNLLKETLALDLPNDSFADLLNSEHAAGFKPSVARGPRRSQVEAAIAAAEIWLQLHGASAAAVSAAADAAKALKEAVGSAHSTSDARQMTSPKPPSYQSVFDSSNTMTEEPATMAPSEMATAPQTSPARVDTLTAGSIAAATTPTHPSPSFAVPQLARLREDVESVASRNSDFSATNTGAPFKWNDPEIFSMSALERLITQLLPQMGGLDHSMAIKRLDFRAFDAVHCVHMLHAVVSLCPNLDTLLLAFTTTCPDLASLQHIICGMGSSKVTGLAIHSVGDALEPAASSEWSGGEIEQAVGLQPLARTFSRLEALGIDVRVDAEVMELISNSVGPALRRLELVNGTGNGNLEMLAAAAVAAYGADPDDEYPGSSRPASPMSSPSSLRETVQSHQIIRLVTRSPQLESVNLFGCTALGGSGVSTSSDLSPDAILAAIASRLPRLRALRVPGNASAVALTAVLSGCPLLEDLDLGPLPPHSPVPALRALIDHGQSIRNLAFRFVPAASASPASPSETAASAQLRHALESIFIELLDRRGRFLRGLDGLGWPATDRIVRALARHCPNLESLVLYPCNAVKSEAAVKDLVTRCRRLVHLGLRGLPVASGGPGIHAGPAPIAVAVAAAEKEVRGRSLGSGPTAMASRRRLDVARLIL